MWGGGEGALAPICCGNEVKEFCELVHCLCPAPRREQVMSEMVNVVPLGCKDLEKPSHDAKIHVDEETCEKELRFASPSIPSEARPKYDLGTYGFSIKPCWYVGVSLEPPFLQITHMHYTTQAHFPIKTTDYYDCPLNTD